MAVGPVVQRFRATLAVAGLISIIACSGSDSPPGDSAATSPAADSFDATVASLCESLQEKTDAVNASATEKEFAELSGQLLDEQRGFVSRARELEPPDDVADAFSDYVDGVETFVKLNEQSQSATSDRDDLRITLQAAENGVSTFEAKEEADLPDSGPPASGGEVYGFLFQAQANVSCFDLGTELDKFGRLQATTDTREESAKLFRFARQLASALVQGIKESIPREINDADVERMVSLYEERVDLFDQMYDAFVSKDEVAYNRAFKEQRRVFMQAERLAQSFGLTECLNFVSVGNA